MSCNSAVTKRTDLKGHSCSSNNTRHLLRLVPGCVCSCSVVQHVANEHSICVSLAARSKFLIAVVFAGVSAAIFLCPLFIHSPCLIEWSELPEKPKLIGHRGAPMVSILLLDTEGSCLLRHKETFVKHCRGLRLVWVCLTHVSSSCSVGAREHLDVV